MPATFVVPSDIILLRGFDVLQAAERKAISMAIPLQLTIVKAFFGATRRSSAEVLKLYG